MSESHPTTEQNLTAADGPQEQARSSRGAAVQTCGMAVAIAALCAYIYAPIRHYGFLISWDDPEFYAANPVVPQGLTWHGIWWALTRGFFSSWHPVTWMSHMVDVELFGLNPGPPHVMSVIIHIVNSVLLFALLRKMTAADAQSAWVALIFAVHPLRVESVAWLAERKDVLSGLFFMLTLWAYTWYAREPRWTRYLAVTALLALGLMSKAMLVTLPFVLLLLDVWPLHRIEHIKANRDSPQAARPTRITPLLLEKVPWLALSVAASIITYAVQRNEGAIGGLVPVPLGARFGNALVAYVAYIEKLFWPAGLAPLYPFPPTIKTGVVLAAALTLLLITYGALRSIRRHPYIAVGWFWYLGTLIPVIGLVQVGSQSMADRYTYLPTFGLLMIIAWGASDLATRLRTSPRTLTILATTTVVACTVVAHQQVAYWQNDRTLWERALAVTKDNYVAQNNLGIVLGQEAQFPQAITHFEEALRIQPNYADAYNNLGYTLARQGRYAEAVPLYIEALRLRPDHAGSRENLATALAQTGRIPEAIEQFSQALRLDPGLAEAHNGLANALVREGNIPAAIPHYAEALRIHPDYAEAHNNLGVALASMGRADEAIHEFEQALRGMPNLAALHYRLAALLEQRGRMEEAIDHYQATLRLDPAHAAAKRALERLQPSGNARSAEGHR